MNRTVEAYEIPVVGRFEILERDVRDEKRYCMVYDNGVCAPESHGLGEVQDIIARLAYEELLQRQTELRDELKEIGNIIPRITRISLEKWLEGFQTQSDKVEEKKE